MWPFKSAVSNAAQLPPRVVHAQHAEKNQHFSDNRIVNTKYTWWTFLPKNLAEQFSLHMNRYFLLIACLQFVRTLTPVNPLTTLGPLVFIFTLSAIKELIDDAGRAKEDKEANSQLIDVVENGQICQKQSSSVRVGDILKISDGGDIPCDLVLLKSSQEHGQAFIQTTNLDGETSLNTRSATAATQALSVAEIMSFQGVVETATPNPHIYKFDSRIWLEPSADAQAPRSVPISLSGDQLLQQTTRLRNTDWAFGLAVYTGNETKFGKNKGDTKIKFTQTDIIINKIAVWMFAFQLVLVLVFGIWGNLWRTSQGHDSWYLYYDQNDDPAWYEWLIIPGRFLLLNSTMIPISLKVSLDICRVFYSRFINWDMRMYDRESDKFAHCNNTSISEDLGQIEYVLTDKTGTLTENIMLFKCCCIGTQFYTTENCTPPSAKTDDVGNVINDAYAVQDNQVTGGGPLDTGVLWSEVHSTSGGGDQERDFLRHICLNNTVFPSQTVDGDFTFQAASPDEKALTDAAWAHNVKLVHRLGTSVTIVVNGTREEYEILAELEFDSDRKRSSVVVRSCETGEMRLFCKGADDVVAARCTGSSDQILAHVDEMAAKGLRTLCFATRPISEKQLQQYLRAFEQANTRIDGRDEAKCRVYEMLECDLVMQGASAIEDLLQDQVPETIALLRKADTRFWMLTGDKFSTALQVATACNLRTSQDPDDLYAIDAERHADIGQQIASHNVKLKERQRQKQQGNDLGSAEATVIIRGVTLEICLGHFKAELLELCLAANAVICCRVTPRQKAELVKMVKGSGAMALAIGDGGNDVQMIQVGHIGIGIRGKEGLQAARAADIQISRFADLAPLMLVHGRQSYIRTALVAQYSFYKSFFFCLMQIGFGFVSGFSGSSLFNSTAVASYNALLFIPVLTIVLDQDVLPERIYKFPQIYIQGVKRFYFSRTTMFYWLARGTLQAVFVLITSFTIIGTWETFVDPGKGYPSDYETLGNATFFGFLWIQSVTIMQTLKYITRLHWRIIWAFHAFAFIILVITNLSLSFENLTPYGSVDMTLASGQTWLMNLFVLVVCCAPLLLREAIRFNFHPSATDHLRWIQATKAQRKHALGTDSESLQSLDLGADRPSIPLTETRSRNKKLV